MRKLVYLFISGICCGHFGIHAQEKLSKYADFKEGKRGRRIVACAAG